jgi:hypothetical protein
MALYVPELQQVDSFQPMVYELARPRWELLRAEARLKQVHLQMGQGLGPLSRVVQQTT